MTGTRTAGPLLRAPFVWFLGARAVSWFGSTMAPVAVTFAVLDLTPSAGLLAAVVAGRTGAFCAFVLFGGVVGDRLPRRLVLQTAHLAAAATQGTAAALLLTGRATVAALVVLEILNGAVSAFTVPALQGIVPQLVPPESMQRATALLALSRNVLQVLGPSFGAVVVVVAGAGWALAVDAASFLLVAALLIRIPVPGGERSGTPGSLVGDLRAGWAEFVGRRWLWVLVSAFALLNAVYGGAWNVIAPIVATSSVGRQGWGLMLSCFSGGTVVAAFVMARLAVRRILVAGVLTIASIGVLLVLVGMAAPLAVLLVASVIGGGGLGVFSIAWETSLAQHVPPGALSRVSATDTFFSFLAMPLGQLGIGLLAVTTEPRVLLVGCGLLYSLGAIMTLAVSDVRRLTTAVPGR